MNKESLWIHFSCVSQSGKEFKNIHCTSLSFAERNPKKDNKNSAGKLFSNIQIVTNEV